MRERKASYDGMLRSSFDERVERAARGIFDGDGLPMDRARIYARDALMAAGVPVLELVEADRDLLLAALREAADEIVAGRPDMAEQTLVAAVLPARPRKTLA